ncbi:hypothetical protein [Rhodopirellula sallentina]|uniref:hypothetical protein n=1 Tax=Rhodopirellula sallentina TaxID=1263869 RepID=UPI001181AEE5|nr:hypothetical protein [Rhodopirellula sallentina]
MIAIAGLKAIAGFMRAGENCREQRLSPSVQKFGLDVDPFSTRITAPITPLIFARISMRRLGSKPIRIANRVQQIEPQNRHVHSRTLTSKSLAQRGSTCNDTVVFSHRPPFLRDETHAFTNTPLLRRFVQKSGYRGHAAFFNRAMDGFDRGMGVCEYLHGSVRSVDPTNRSESKHRIVLL